ncbi:MAG: LPS export ABC transporter permease LptF, partial [Gammaproteobacteria bacterium]|nr:LPS export ABC transporter permease LptF [Gammaproteobacteria bacterium]
MIVSRYLTRQVLGTLAIVTLVLLLVAIGGRFIGYLAD